MSPFSFKKSSTTNLSSSSPPSSMPLNDTVEETERDTGFERNNRGFLGKLRSPGFRRGRRSKSPATRVTCRSYSPKPESRTKPKMKPQAPPPPPETFRLGMNFCGICDMRIATLFLNTVHIVVAIIAELIEATKWGNRNYFTQPPILLLLVIGISGAGTFGALHFAENPLIGSSICLCFLWYMYLVDLHFLGLVLVPMILFAQAVLANEIRHGVMNEDTYAMEEYLYMDSDGRKMIETVHGLSVDIGETAAEFAEEVVIEVKRKSSGGSQLATA